MWRGYRLYQQQDDCRASICTFACIVLWQVIQHQFHMDSEQMEEDTVDSSDMFLPSVFMRLVVSYDFSHRIQANLPISLPPSYFKPSHPLLIHV